MVARILGVDEVEGSIPSSPTIFYRHRTQSVVALSIIEGRGDTVEIEKVVEAARRAAERAVRAGLMPEKIHLEILEDQFLQALREHVGRITTARMAG